jgi:hypothetical protein
VLHTLHKLHQIYEKMQDIGKQTKGAKKKIATWAKSKGTEHSRLQQFNGGGGEPCGYGIANAIVFSKVCNGQHIILDDLFYTLCTVGSTCMLEHKRSLSVIVVSVIVNSVQGQYLPSLRTCMYACSSSGHLLHWACLHCSTVHWHGTTHIGM